MTFENLITRMEEKQNKSERNVRRALDLMTRTEERQRKTERGLEKLNRAIVTMEETEISRGVIGVLFSALFLFLQIVYN